jgi:hypothetical protein
MHRSFLGGKKDFRSEIIERSSPKLLLEDLWVVK